MMGETTIKYKFYFKYYIPFGAAPIVCRTIVVALYHNLYHNQKVSFAKGSEKVILSLYKI